MYNFYSKKEQKNFAKLSYKLNIISDWDLFLPVCKLAKSNFNIKSLM